MHHKFMLKDNFFNSQPNISQTSYLYAENGFSTNDYLIIQVCKVCDEIDM